MLGLDLAREVTCAEPYAVGAGPGERRRDEPPFRVVAYDFGMKQNILRMLVATGCDVTVVPATTSAAEATLSAPVKQGTFKVVVTTTGELRARKFVQIQGPSTQAAQVYQSKITWIIP